MNNEIIIRQATVDDADAITRLTEQLGYSLSKKQIAENIKTVLSKNDQTVFVADRNSNVIGWIGLAYSIQIETALFCVVNGLVVEEAFRGHGIGKLLVERAKQWCKEKDYDVLRLRCNMKRTEAHLFYRHIGFEEIKQQTVFEIKIK